MCERVHAALGVRLTAGVGAVVDGRADVRRSRADAGAEHLHLPAVVRMLEHDAEDKTPYAESVLAYLAASQDVPAAADKVNVHQTTFRYRLRRVREMFALDLEDPDVRLLTWLHLRTAR